MSSQKCQPTDNLTGLPSCQADLLQETDNCLLCSAWQQWVENNIFGKQQTNIVLQIFSQKQKLSNQQNLCVTLICLLKYSITVLLKTCGTMTPMVAVTEYLPPTLPLEK